MKITKYSEDTTFNNGQIHDEAYPTPRNLAIKMWHKLKDGKDVRGLCLLEPSAFKGDLLEVVTGTNYEKPDMILCCEITPKFHSILREEYLASVVGTDYLDTYIGFPVDLIIANPPFSNGVIHTLKMWSDLANGGRMVVILNAETVRNQYSKNRKALGELIEKYGEVEELGQPFLSSQTERKTPVEVVMVTLNKPQGESVLEIESFLGQFDNSKVDFSNEGFVQALQRNDKTLIDKLKTLSMKYAKGEELLKKELETRLTFDVFCGDFYETSSHSHNTSDIRKSIRKDIQNLRAKVWNKIYNLSDISSRLSSNMREELQSKIKTWSDTAPTMKNIWVFLDIIIQNQHTFEKESIYEVYKMFTSSYRATGGYATNDGFEMREQVRYSGLKSQYSNYLDWNEESTLKNVNIAIKNILGETTFLKQNGMYNIDSEKSYCLADIVDAMFRNEYYNAWVETKHWSVKIYKKGSMFFKLKSTYLVNEINKIAAEKLGHTLRGEKETFNQRKKS